MQPAAKRVTYAKAKANAGSGFLKSKETNGGTRGMKNLESVNQADPSTEPFLTDKRPLHIRVQEHLRTLIAEEAYQAGQQLPPETKLAAELGVSRATLREALRGLEQEGAIVRKHGVGTFVAARYGQRLESGLERLESIPALAAQQGMKVHCKGLDVKQEIADQELADRLQVTPGSRLTSVRRVIEIDGTPVAYMLDVAPVSILSPADVEENFTCSVLDCLRMKQDVQIVHATADIMALNADDFLAQKLGVELEQAVLLMEETLFDKDGAVVEFSRNYFIPDCFCFHIVRR
jgi:GntR family transcriptional regulator